MSRRITALLAGAILLAIAIPASADILLLRDGRIFDDRPMERVEGGVKIKFENGEVLVRDDLIQDAVLENDPLLLPKTDEEREKAEKGYVRFEGRWVTTSRRDELVTRMIEDRKAEIEEIRSHEEWRDRRIEKTKHFEIEYTVPPHIHEYYRDKMEAYFSEFQKTWKLRVPRDAGRLKVCFYSDREKFHQISGAPGGALAYFRFVQPWELNFFYDRLDQKLTEEVLFHEMSHYLQQLLDPDFSMPHFPGESLSEYYGASKWDPERKKLTTGMIKEGRLAYIKIEIKNGEILGLEKMVSTSEMYEHYSWGWTLVHFCMNNSKYAKKFQNFVKSLVNGRDVKREPIGFGSMKSVPGPEVWRVFQACMGLRNRDAVKAFEEEWHKYVQEDLKLETSTGLEKAAVAAQQDGRKLRAKRLFSEAIAAGSTNALTYHRYAELMDRDGKEAEAIKLWRRAIELDPLEASFYMSLGRALADGGNKDEGKKLLSLAKELDPEIRSIDEILRKLE